MITFFFTESGIEGNGVAIYMRYKRDSTDEKIHAFFSPLPLRTFRNASHLSDSKQEDNVMDDG